MYSHVTNNSRPWSPRADFASLVQEVSCSVDRVDDEGRSRNHPNEDDVAYTSVLSGVALTGITSNSPYVGNHLAKVNSVC